MIDLPFIAVNSGTGGGSTGGVEITHVEYYANLPAANLNSGKYYFVDKDTIWNKLNPLAKTQGGLYRSDGTTWLGGLIPELAGVSDGTNVLVDYPVVFSGVTVDNTAKTVTINSQTDNNLTNALKTSYDGAVTKSNIILSNGDGSKYLADDGLYKTVESGSSLTEAQQIILANTSGINTGDETQESIIQKIGFTSLDQRTINFRSAGQSYSSNVIAKCIISDIYGDTLSEVSSSTNRVTLAKDSKFFLNIMAVGSTNNVKTINIYKNGNSYNSVNFNGAGFQYNAIFTFTAGSYLEFYLQTSTSEVVSVQVILNSMIY